MRPLPKLYRVIQPLPCYSRPLQYENVISAGGGPVLWIDIGEIFVMISPFNSPEVYSSNEVWLQILHPRGGILWISPLDSPTWEEVT